MNIPFLDFFFCDSFDIKDGIRLIVLQYREHVKSFSVSIIIERVVLVYHYKSLYIPGYQFCGPGTHLEKQLARGDQGINSLDAACREHDIAYSQSNNLIENYVADRIVAKRARRHIIAKDSTLRELQSQLFRQ
ncbi:hypothetical protein ACFW04_013950 [Cataglyphis niger]